MYLTVGIPERGSDLSLAPVVGGDEAVAFLLAEPPNRSLGHMPEPAFHSQGLRTNKKAAPSSGRRLHQNKTHLLLFLDHTIAVDSHPEGPGPVDLRHGASLSQSRLKTSAITVCPIDLPIGGTRVVRCMPPNSGRVVPLPVPALAFLSMTT